MMDGQLNLQEQSVITQRIRELKPSGALEVGTWMGGGSTLHILKALHANDHGHLWGIEACKSIYDQMVANISSAGAEMMSRFTPVLGVSQQMIPELLTKQPGTKFDFVFLDGGDNPMEQVEEFQILHDSMPVGAVLLSHDAKRRKGKWLVPYVEAHDNWQCTLHNVSEEGLFEARKIAAAPSAKSLTNAASVLRSLRREPKELLGRLLPTPVINVILALLPEKILLSITQDRRSN